MQLDFFHIMLVSQLQTVFAVNAVAFQMLSEKSKKPIFSDGLVLVQEKMSKTDVYWHENRSRLRLPHTRVECSVVSVRPQLNQFPLIKTTFIKTVHVKMMTDDSLTNNWRALNTCLYLLWSASDGKVMTASARLPDS